MKARPSSIIVWSFGKAKHRRLIAILVCLGICSAGVGLMRAPLSNAQASENVATFADDCATPQTIFLLGDTVCAVATNSPPGGHRRFEWVSPDGVIFQLGPEVNSNPQTNSITIPTSGPFAQVGSWTVKTVDVSNNGHAGAKFVVQDPANAAVDLWCPISAPFEVSPGSSAPFTVIVTNKGPNDAENVVLTVTTATNTTFQSETQVTGPVFTCTNPEVGTTGSSTCTIDTLPANTTAQFTFVFQVDAGASPGSGVSSTATVTSETGELFDTDNTFTATVDIAADTCDVSCPPNITEPKDASICGKIINFAIPSGSGAGCGTIVCSPAPDSVFPIGTTNVVCFGDSGGPCSFTVTIEDPGASITCPANVSQSESSPGLGSAVVTYAAPTFPDSCSVSAAACSPPSGSSFPVGTTTVSCQTTNSSSATLSCSFTVQVNSLTCILLCPEDVFATESPAGSNTAIVTFSSATPSGCPAVTTTCAPPSGSSFPVGTTTVNCTSKDASNTTVATCSFAVTVSPAAPCTLTCPPNVFAIEDGNPNPDPGAVVTYPTPTAQNCPSVTVSCSPASGTRFPIGATPVACVATTPSSVVVAACSFTVTVDSLSGITITVNNDPGQCGAIVTYNPAILGSCSGTLTCSPPPGSFFPVGVTPVNCVNDAPSPCSFNFNVAVLNTNAVPIITAPASSSLYVVGSTVNFSGSFTDDAGSHTAQWTFNGAGTTTTVDATVVETTGTSGTVSASHTFNTIGVYLVTLSVSDQCGGTGTTETIGDLTAMVVIYDPSAGFLTGGGWITSPAGAYVAGPTVTGKLSFGLNAKYHNNSTIPTGQTEVQFRTADFNFHSTSYDWLLITGNKGQYSGSGTVNGSGNYGFTVTVLDNGGGGSDKFRLKIWNKNDGNAVVYDNQMGAPDNADPITTLGGGNIVIH